MTLTEKPFTPSTQKWSEKVGGGQKYHILIKVFPYYKVLVYVPSNTLGSDFSVIPYRKKVFFLTRGLWKSNFPRIVFSQIYGTLISPKNKINYIKV